VFLRECSVHVFLKEKQFVSDPETMVSDAVAHFGSLDRGILFSIKITPCFEQAFLVKAPLLLQGRKGFAQ